MTIENEMTMTGTGGLTSGRSSPVRDDTKETAKAEAGEVAATAKDAGKDVLDEVTAKTSEVAATAKGEIHRLIDQASTEMKTVGRERSQQLAATLESLAQQMRAMREGRAEEATELRSWMTQAEQKMQHYASSLRQRGPEGVLGDVRSFARRRPGMFLLAAGIGGFAIGRAVRSGAMSSPESDGESMSDYSSNGRYSTYGGSRDDLALPIEYSAATVVIEPADTLPPPATGTTTEWETP